jgi:hypothetical protein
VLPINPIPMHNLGLALPPLLLFLVLTPPCLRFVELPFAKPRLFALRGFGVLDDTWRFP